MQIYWLCSCISKVGDLVVFVVFASNERVIDIIPLVSNERAFRMMPSAHAFLFTGISPLLIVLSLEWVPLLMALSMSIQIASAASIVASVGVCFSNHARTNINITALLVLVGYYCRSV